MTHGVSQMRGYAASMIGSLRVVLAMVLVAFWTAGARADDRDQERVLEGRLMAPCCWIQTLDVHESPLARELRSEVHARLGAGESTVAIEADLVERYGERIRAVPVGTDPRRAIGLGSVLVVAGSGALLLGWLVRVVRRGRRRHVQPRVRGEHDAYDARLDDELAEHVG